MRCLAWLLAVALCTSGCPAGAHDAKTWPTVPSNTGWGAVLFAAQVVPPPEGLYFKGYAMYFYSTADPNGFFVELMDKNRKGDDLYLVELPVGAYSNTSVIGLVVGWLQLDPVGGLFDKFTVRAGEITVLGKVEASIEVMGEKTRRRNVGARYDAATMTSVVDAAIARVGPASPWAAKLAAAKASLPSAPASREMPARSTSGCAKDTDCKGDRICVDRACVDPQRPSP